MGGENTAAGLPAAGAGGSSPHGRGKQAIASLLMTNPRLIPAWTGKTRTRRAGSLITAAHPRVDGENAQHAPARASRYGLIPARAGKTSAARSPWLRWSAHPRAGGENRGPCGHEYAPSGSSPRGRGKRRRLIVASHHVGLIPARAGKTLCDVCTDQTVWAHPRAGGENVKANATTGETVGSSPRGRGKLGDDRA